MFEMLSGAFIQSSSFCGHVISVHRRVLPAPGTRVQRGGTGRSAQSYEAFATRRFVITGRDFWSSQAATHLANLDRFFGKLRASNISTDPCVKFRTGSLYLWKLKKTRTNQETQLSQIPSYFFRENISPLRCEFQQPKATKNSFNSSPLFKYSRDS